MTEFARNPATYADLEAVPQEKGCLRARAFAGEDEVGAPPFSAITFSLTALWPFDPPADPAA